MKYLFGPVNSRRLGLSQGIDLIPEKICNFNCIYCEVGPTTNLTCERREFVPVSEVVAEIDELLAGKDNADSIDVYTITGSGEPTLHSGIGKIIGHLKSRAQKPVAVLTNGSLLHRREVREDLLAADIVIPSLDAARKESFLKINRPATCVVLEEIIDGLAMFAREFSGHLWLEILLAKGVNDASEDIEALLAATTRIGPERIQLNTVARPPLELYAHPLGKREMEAAAERLATVCPGRVDILVDFSKRKGRIFRPVAEEEILQVLKRRPCTAADISEALQFELGTVGRVLKKIEDSGRIIQAKHNGNIYYQTVSKLKTGIE